MPEERKHIRFLRISPSSFHDTWSKAFHSKKSSKSQSTESDKPTDQELHARVAAIKSVLEDIEPGINVISNLIQIFRENGHYCDCCSPEKRKAGSCGSSCALLRPKGGDPGITVVIVGVWVKRAAMTKGQYLCIAREIRKAGDNLKANKVSKWELDVADMQQGLTSRLEKAWKEGLMSKEIKEVEGLDLEWTFEQACGEKEAEVELAPDELPQ